MTLTWGGIIAAIVTALFVLVALKTSNWWTRFVWMPLLIVGGIAETYALFSVASDDTLTETVRASTVAPVAFTLLAVGMTWLWFHFVIEKRGKRDQQ